MRRPIIAGNWKLNKTIKEAVRLATMLKRLVAGFERVDIVVCPPFTAIAEVAEALAESGIEVGAQDIYWEETGAFTGEVSASLVKEAGAQFAIIGHSERRRFFHETNESVNKKTKAALTSGLVPIVCVGETLAEREARKTFRVLEEQLKGAFSAFSGAQMQRLVIAYEPVWAIGTGKVAAPAEAEEAHAFIRNWLATSFGDQTAAGLRIQYGGSVKPENISDLMREPDIDGALVGGASLDANAFAGIIRNAAAAEMERI